MKLHLFMNLCVEASHGHSLAASSNYRQEGGRDNAVLFSSPLSSMFIHVSVFVSMVSHAMEVLSSNRQKVEARWC